MGVIFLDVNGKVIHLVQRAPPVPQGNNADGGSVRNTTNTNTRRNQPWRTLFQQAGTGGNAMYLGAMAFPADLMDAQGKCQRLVIILLSIIM